MMMELTFKKPYEERKRSFIPCGSKYENEYGYEKNKKGRTLLVKTGEVNIYEKIQEALEETQIENVIARVTAGDTSSLRPDGIYTDCTELPSNLMESQRAIMNLENTWNSLPLETRREYNFDKGEFIADAGSENWLKKMGYKHEVAEDLSQSIKVSSEVANEPKGETEA